MTRAHVVTLAVEEKHALKVIRERERERERAKERVR